MPNYVDGFVVPVAKNKLKPYFQIAKKASKIWRELGALDYKECALDDAEAPWALPFTKGIRAKPGETIVLAYIVYKSRAHRDRVNAAVMKDPRIAAICDPKNMPFDCKRMLYGGFKVVVAG
jgi:uncharacterized protein YbaA (DUF1428 family)